MTTPISLPRSLSLGLLCLMMIGAQSGCIFAEDNNNVGEPEPWMPTDPDPKVDPDPQAELDVVYVSGHLGNYSSCPEKGYQPGETSTDANRGAPAEPSGDFAPGACEEGTECGGIYNCSEAQLTLNVENESADVDAEGVSVTLIELLDAEGMVRAELPVRGIVEVMTQQSFDGEVASSSTIQVRVDYKGPVSLYELLADQDAGSDRGAPVYGYGEARLRITVEATNADGVVVETKSIYTIPDVAT